MKKLAEIKKSFIDKKDQFIMDSKRFWREHWKDVLTATPVVIAGGKFVYGVAKDISEKHDEKVRESRVYDPSLGDWWDLKKPLTTSQRLELESRVQNGEPRGQVLNDMGVLKRR